MYNEIVIIFKGEVVRDYKFFVVESKIYVMQIGKKILTNYTKFNVNIGYFFNWIGDIKKKHFYMVYFTILEFCSKIEFWYLKWLLMLILSKIDKT